MKITYKGDYALKALFQLALNYEKEPGGVMSITEISKLGDMPVKFLEQILLILRKGGFVKAKRGIRGGFFLARPPKEITIGEVVRFVEGPIAPIECATSDNYKGCKDTACCIFRDVWKEVNFAISTIVDTITFEELMIRHKERGLKLKSVYEYSI
jgi:Rrf2 family protein